MSTEKIPTDAASATDDRSLKEKFGLAAIGLLTPLLGGILGGRDGAMAGGAAGLKAVGTQLEKDDERAYETKKATKVAEAAEGKRTKDLEDYERRLKLQSQYRPEKEDKPLKVGNSLVAKTEEGYKPVYTAPGTPKDESASPKEVRSAAKSSGDSLQRQVTPYNNAIKGAEEAEKLAGMAKTNPRAAGALLGKLARAAGEVGVLSDSDISRLGGSQAVAERIERFTLLSTTDQKITDDDIRYAQELARAMKETATAQKESVVADSVSRFSTNYQVDPKKAHKLLTGQDPQKPAPAANDDDAAVKWASDPANAKDPRAIEILKLNGAK
jgi:hypothetical protein